MNPLLDAAKRYRALGLHPIPVEPRGKRPLVPWREYMTRQPTEHEIEQWWAVTPDANVALALGRGVFAVDIDGPEGEAALEAAGIALPELAPMATTGKGRHVFLAGSVADRIGVLPKVDIRSDGGYVVAPPSVHPSGKRYAWVTSFEEQPPAAPAALLELLARPTRPTPDQGANSDWLTVALAGVGEGQRDQTCTRLAGYFLGKGVPAEAVEPLLVAWADRCTPPFPAAQVIKCIASIARRQGPVEAPQSAASISIAVDEALAEVKAGRSVVSPTELGELDKLLDGGTRPGDYILLGARPSVGKTALALQIARRKAKAGQGVLIVSREMRRTPLVRRLLVQESKVRAGSVKVGELVDIEWDMLRAGAERLRQLPIWITDSAVSIAQIEDEVRERANDIGFLVIDYLQLVRAPAEVGRGRPAVEYISQEIRRITNQYSVATLCLSSLSRPPKDAGEKWRPQLSDLRESGELEHDADIILFLHRAWQSDVCEAILAKQRDGRVDTIKLQFKGEFLSFEDLAA